MNFSLKAMTRFLERHLLILGIVVAVLILGLGLLFITWPRLQEVQKLGGLNYNQKVDALHAEQQYLGDLHTLQTEVRNISPDDIRRLSAIVPHSKDIPGIFRQMQGFASEVHMQLLSVAVSDGSGAAPAGATGATSLHTLSISVILGGVTLDYSGLKDFLATTARQAPLLDLLSVSYSPATSTASSSYSFNFRSYYLGS